MGRAKELVDIIEFVEFTNLFRRIERTIWYKGVDGPERNGEHVFQLALVAWFVVTRCKLSLQMELVIEYVLVHDLVETYAQDTPAFPHPERCGQRTHADKEERERTARRRIAREWGTRFPGLVQRMARYNLQPDEESRFVYALDKLVSQLNVYTDGGRTNHILQVTRPQLEAYKLPRVAKHGAVAELFAELLRLYDRHPGFLHQSRPPT